MWNSKYETLFWFYFMCILFLGLAKFIFLTYDNLNDFLKPQGDSAENEVLQEYKAAPAESVYVADNGHDEKDKVIVDTKTKGWCI